MDGPEAPVPTRRPLLAAVGRRLAFLRTSGEGGIASPGYLGRWIIFGLLLGIAAGVGAIIFYWLLDTSTHLFLGHLAGYLPPSPRYEGNRPIEPLTAHSRWLLPGVVALGALISGLIVYFFAPESKGDGADAAVEAFHHRGGRIRARIPPFTALSAAITLGAGGSGGREGPTAQISAGFGSLMADIFHLDTRERRILMAAGIGAGIGAVFRAPLGGALLAAEIPYTHDMEVEALMPALIASIVGYSIYGAVYGYYPLFGYLSNPNELGFTNPLQLVYYAILGILCGVFGVLYAKFFYATSDFFDERVALPRWLKPVTGGLLVGAIGMALPEVLGTGYGWAQLTLSPAIITTLPLWIIIILPFAKILATSLSVGSGGSAGLFGAGVVIGGMVGAAFWALGHTVLPGMPSNPTSFSVVAMMALFGGIVHAPLAIMLMVAEMTGNLSLLAPAMLAVFVASLIAGDTTIYRAQLPTRADSPAHRYRYSFPLLGSLSVRDAMRPLTLVLRGRMSVSEAEHAMAQVSLPGAPVVDDAGQLSGVLTLTDVEHVPPDDRGNVPVSRSMTRDPVTITPGASLDRALDTLATHQVSWMPVVEPPDDHVVGTVSASSIVHAYRGALNWTVHRLRGITSGTVLLESRLDSTSPLAGKTLRDTRLPPETLVVSIQREGATIMPRGDTRLLPGDLMVIITSEVSEPRVREYLQGATPLSDLDPENLTGTARDGAGASRPPTPR
ncbi:MAG TPA: chloride channel protein [Thermomicrobiaceae bacterium]|nr:chloride channel protein [Thermomicrobiaceae bacterium]